VDNQQSLNELHLFAGAGGGILASELLGHRTVCAVEINEYAREVLVSRQNDGTFPPFPIWDDVCTFDGTAWRGIVDIVSGGFPCQDISVAGKGAGLSGERSGLWSEFARIICEVRPRYAFIENSPMLTHRGLDRVLSDLAEMGFDVAWGVVSAADVGAPHLRERVWILGYANINGKSVSPKHDEASILPEMGNTDNNGQAATKITGSIGEGSNDSKTRQIKASESTRSGEQYEELADTNSAQCQRSKCAKRGVEKYADIGSGSWWQAEPDLPRVSNGVAYQSHRLTAIGNGQVPLCAATAFRLLKGRLDAITRPNDR
jgi:DNA (cytosine-5)-methyltransferase 1